ncbi:hypothetical protein DFA_11481 [Cavenderia fasciculata]|uniref:Uncharacterized protein n=1 Tax=Cavenderia fasciculata TaxID=261658 RepID=F4QD92_CACFS|nr:uncharacterized protein DFA_11481 [Cavenderia fasciculata]EGG13720.1 hypothetical protein DFA_11481 [Cavenderia fasciculata]|eukprot:XP_004350424.1 hypothetical protein DFA_11481 [Cavenderia fasciculata]
MDKNYSKAEAKSVLDISLQIARRKHHLSVIYFQSVSANCLVSTSWEKKTSVDHVTHFKPSGDCIKFLCGLVRSVDIA